MKLDPLELIPEPLNLAVKVGKKGIEAYLARRADIAREELVLQMTKGKPWKISDDRTAAMALQFRRAWEEGVAKANLRLLAQAIANEGSEPSLGHSEFRRHSENLAGLTYPEIVVCARLVEIQRAAPARPADADDEQLVAEAEVRISLFSKFVLPLAADPLFGSRDAVSGTCIALQRTGWLRVLSVFGDPMFTPTPSFDAVAKMVEFEEAMAAGVE